MGLFDWLRRRTPAHRELPVRYGLGPPPVPRPADLCPLCGGGITDERLAVHPLTANGLGWSVWAGRCSACDTILTRSDGPDSPPGWRPNAPGAADLVAVATEEEVAGLDARFGGHRVFGPEWGRFLARRGGDEVWRFAAADGREGYAVVRAGRPLNQFLVPDDDLVRALA